MNGAREIMREVAKSSVEELNLQGSVKDGAVLSSILVEIANSKILTKIDLKINDIKGESAKSIELFMKKCHAMDVNLDLFYNDLQASGAKCIANGLRDGSKVTKLE